MRSSGTIKSAGGPFVSTRRRLNQISEGEEWRDVVMAAAESPI